MFFLFYQTNLLHLYFLKSDLNILWNLIFLAVLLVSFISIIHKYYEFQITLKKYLLLNLIKGMLFGITMTVSLAVVNTVLEKKNYI